LTKKNEVDYAIDMVENYDFFMLILKFFSSTITM